MNFWKVYRVLNNYNVLVVVNVRDHYSLIDVPGMWSGKTVTNLMTGQPMQVGKKFNLAPYQYLLLHNNNK